MNRTQLKTRIKVLQAGFILMATAFVFVLVLGTIGVSGSLLVFAYLVMAAGGILAMAAVYSTFGKTSAS